MYKKKVTNCGYKHFENVTNRKIGKSSDDVFNLGYYFHKFHLPVLILFLVI